MQVNECQAQLQQLEATLQSTTAAVKIEQAANQVFLVYFILLF
jgi:hypothetical protein